MGGKGAGTAGHMVGGRADGSEESEGADGAAGLFRNFEGPMPFTLAAAHVHISAFWAALHASGAAAWLELTPPLYGSVNLMHACLQLRFPIQAVARGLDASVSAWAHFCLCFVPMHFAVSAHMKPC